MNILLFSKIIKKKLKLFIKKDIKDSITFNTQNKQITILNDMAFAFNDGIYYEINVEYWLKKLLGKIKNPVFYDVGSNYGYYSIILSSITGKTYSFEPVKETYKILKKNIVENKLLNVKSFNIALSDKNDSTFIYKYTSSGNNSMFNRNIPENHPTKLIGKIEIKTEKIDDLINKGILEKPDLIKVDVEGAELSVLKGAMKTLEKYHPILLLEYSETTSKDAGYSCIEIVNLLKKIDYVIYGLMEDFEDLKLILFDENKTHLIANILAVPKQFNIT